MEEVITIGIDLAKSVFQIHGVDAEGEVIIRRQLRRRQMLPFFKKQPPCLVGIEACATSHHWARQLVLLGHQVKLMPPRYVKPYVKRNKNDIADAEAICEAVTRPTMRFVTIKTEQQQSVLMLHKTRQLFVRQRTMLINALRAHLAEYGIVAGVGRNGLETLLDVIEGGDDERIPPAARDCLLSLRAQLTLVKQQILEGDRRILACHRTSEVSLRLEDIPPLGHVSMPCRAAGVGPLIASALVATVADPHAFKTGRDLSAWIGLVPRQNSTGGKERLGHISKAGNRYLRSLLVVGAMSVICRAKKLGYTRRPWLAKIMERRSTKVAAVALANKRCLAGPLCGPRRIARTAWAMMAHGTYYKEPDSQAV